ncbi:MAG: hypothetical protein LBU91_05215 [Bacteroidales bacterium]|jgi:hypothetical protein|nr:hypothetical protein [Bacteroidales bacterium]
MNVSVDPSVKEYLNDLVTILYEKGYFSFEDYAHNYVDGLLDDITQTLPLRLKKPAPPHYNKYGKGLYYAVFKKNKNTSWYAFFRIYRKDGELYYQVRYIANNHTSAQYL